MTELPPTTTCPPPGSAATFGLACHGGCRSGSGAAQIMTWLAANPSAAHGLAASLLAGLATGLGAPAHPGAAPSFRSCHGAYARPGWRHDAGGQPFPLAPAGQLVAAGTAPAGWASPRPRPFSPAAGSCRLSTGLPHAHVEAVGDVTALGRPAAGSAWWWR